MGQAKRGNRQRECRKFADACGLTGLPNQPASELPASTNRRSAWMLVKTR